MWESLIVVKKIFMTKIEAFIEKVQDENIPVSKLLITAKLLAGDLGQTDILKWLNLEISGYHNDDSYPEYRSMNGQMKAWNPYHGWVPVIHPSTEIEKKFCTRNASQSIREVEELLSDKSDSYEMPYPASFAEQILKGEYKTKLSMFISRTSLLGILNSVRNKLLDWAVELKNKGVLGEEEKFTEQEKKEAQIVESKFSIGNIENFHGNVGEKGEYNGKILTPTESFWSKAFWYIFVALVVVVVGNIASALILNHFFGI